MPDDDSLTDPEAWQVQRCERGHRFAMLRSDLASAVLDAARIICPTCQQLVADLGTTELETVKAAAANAQLIADTRLLVAKRKRDQAEKDAKRAQRSATRATNKAERERAAAARERRRAAAYKGHATRRRRQQQPSTGEPEQ